MATTFRSKSAVFNTVGTSATATEPAGTASGDFLLGLYIVDAVSATCAIPAGWTSLFSGLVTSNFRWNLGWILRAGSAPSYAFTHAGSTYRELHVLCFTGNDGTTPIDSSAQSSTGTLNNPDPPSTTAVDSAALAIAVGIGWNGSATAWAHAAYTIRSDNTATNDAVVATRQLAAGGAENPAAFTGSSGASGATWAATVTIKPAGGGGATVVKQLAALGVG